MDPLYALLESALPNDRVIVSSAEQMLQELSSTTELSSDSSILDFGCGGGEGFDTIRKIWPGAHYVGIDIEGSPEVRSRTRTDGEFRTYDGYTLPFSSKRFHALDTRRVFGTRPIS
jgi:SAM-dependent methyltransferase